MQTLDAYMLFGMTLTVVVLGIASVLLFQFLPSAINPEQRKSRKYFILFFAAASAAFAVFAVLVKVLNPVAALLANSGLYIFSIHCLYHGLLVRKNKSAKRLMQNKCMLANILFILIFQYIGHVYFPEYAHIRVAVFNVNLIVLFFSCLPLVADKNSQGEETVRYAIYAMSFVVVLLIISVQMPSTFEYYSLIVMGVQALQFHVWLGALSALIMSDNIQMHYQNSVTDSMTGVPNRRYFVAQVKSAIKVGQQKKQPMAMVICDIDHFKSVNDQYGHETGDTVIKEFAKGLKAILRSDDTLARMGGEEFAVFLPNTTKAEAVKLAERMRSATEELLISSVKDEPISVTASFGIASFEDAADINHYLSAADHAMYEAKKSGRNRVCAFSSDVAAAKSLTNFKAIVTA